MNLLSIFTLLNDVIQDGRNHSIPDISAENVLDGQKDPGGGIQKDKLPISSLLKTFVKGTTLFGMLFLVLHIRCVFRYLLAIASRLLLDLSSPFHFNTWVFDLTVEEAKRKLISRKSY